ncbi:MAG: metallopeptidase family protein, partial [Desulfobacterales bacterium]|nr:metallopeptidase family protein [Desulfobacterales bacterium]
MKLNSRQFDQIVQQALDRIPVRFRDTMDNLLITVEQRPSRELLEEMDLPPDEPLFGIFEGIPLPERSVVEPPLYPDRIILFQQPLQQYCRSLEELKSEIEITVVHELAHYLGMDEAELQD